MIAPLSTPYIEIAEGTSTETVCCVNTSVGVSPVWLHSNGTEVDEVITTCLDAECFCEATFIGVFYVLTTNLVHDTQEGSLISQHELTLFVCNATTSLQGEYNCSVKSKESGFEDVQATFNLTVSVSDDPNLIILVGVPVLIVLLVLNVVAISAMAACCLSLRRKPKRNHQEVTDNSRPIPARAVDNYYTCRLESQI